MYHVYPALFTPSNGGYIVKMPDIQGCVAKGTTIPEAMELAQDALGGCLCVLQDESLPIPTPSAVYEIPTESEGEFVSLVGVDIERHRQRTDNRAVKLNVTVPAWLKVQASNAGLNFSKILQRGLKEELGIK